MALLPLKQIIGRRDSLIQRLSSVARDYAWGSHTLIPDHLNIESTGRPMAEIWFGTHPAWPTPLANEERSLEQLRNHQPLPFLLKFLAAEQPLSIQAHPSKQQAEAGFAAEESLGVPLDSPDRDYRDDNHKPEVIVALTPFKALIGFRPASDIALSLQRLILQAQQSDFTELEARLADCLHTLRTRGLQALFEELLGARGHLDQVTEQLSQLAHLPIAVENVETQNLLLVPQLQSLYPGDPGIIVAQLLNLVELHPMEAAELPAGNVHAYISGLGVELMAASDNVLRGGLTPKRINVPELLKVVDFSLAGAPVLHGEQLAAGLWRYPTVAPDYLLYRIEVDGTRILADIKIENAAIIACTAGEVAVGDSLGNREVLRAGQAAYLADARFYSFTGAGTAFLATS
ncbi:MAG: mannose-6-phosphate isomerase, class I [Micrococcales bacterium]